MENEVLTKEAIKKKLLIPFIIVLIGAVLLVSTLFLPYTTAIGEYAESIEEFPDIIVDKELDMSAKDLANVSMVEYIRIYSASDRQFNVVLVAVIGVFALLTLLFAVLKKPIAVIVFDILVFATFCLQNYDYSDRGIVPSELYDWGVAYYLFFIAAAAALIGAVWMLVKKAQIKKMDNADAQLT